MIEWPPEPVPDKVIPWLERRDAASREDRARWHTEVQQVIDGFPNVWGFSAGAQESDWFHLEAVVCYRQGLFLSALICAHATCEQELAGEVAHRAGSEPPRGWERWGLGRLIEHVEALGWHSPETVALLKTTNENRRSVYHMRDMFAPDSLFRRAYAREPWFDKDEIKPRMREELRLNALEAIRAAFAVRVDGEEEFLRTW